MILDLARAILLGVVQGLTEFLPVSSTGHLILAEELLGIDQAQFGLTFDAALHIGTLLSVLVYFRATWAAMLDGIVQAARRRQPLVAETRALRLIALGTLPAAIAGFFLESTIEESLRSPALVGAMLVVFSLPMIAAESCGARTRSEGELRWRDSVVIGGAQAIALVPGASRSGMTISAGLLTGLTRDAATRFAFLLSAPIIAGAGAKQLIDVAGAYADGELSPADLAFFGAGFVSSALVGYAAISMLTRFVGAHGLMPFVFYRVALGVTVLGLVIRTSII